MLSYLSVALLLCIIHLPLSLQNAFSITLVAGRHTRSRNAASAVDDHHARYHNASSSDNTDRAQQHRVKTARKEAGSPVYNCSPSNAFISGKIFNGKFRHDHANCPNEVWLIDMFAADENRHLVDKVLVNVGYNKGYNFAEWLAIFAPWSGVTSELWHKAIESKVDNPIKRPCGVCNECKVAFAHKNQSHLNATFANHSSTPSHHSRSRHPYLTMIGVDINSANLDLLKHIAKFIEGSKGRANFRHTSMFAVTAAAGDNNSIVEAHVCNGGDEECSLLVNSVDRGNMSTIKVQQLTMDSLVDVLIHHSIISARNGNVTSTSSPLLPLSSSPLIKPVIDILKIDAEGIDPAVLNGTRRLLEASNVRCVIFEAHEIGMWERFSLGDVVATFDSFDYDCYFEGSARLWPITGACWTRSFDERKTWSNILCVARRDIWWDAVQKYVVWAG